MTGERRRGKVLRGMKWNLWTWEGGECLNHHPMYHASNVVGTGCMTDSSVRSLLLAFDCIPTN